MLDKWLRKRALKKELEKKKDSIGSQERLESRMEREFGVCFSPIIGQHLKHIARDLKRLNEEKQVILDELCSLKGGTTP